MDKHPDQYAKIQEWLGESAVKLKAAQALAREGMKGPGGVGEVPSLIGPRSLPPPPRPKDIRLPCDDEEVAVFEAILGAEGLEKIYDSEE